MVTVRFAPSPTGRLHVGNVRTALLNWLFAYKAGGQFLLRLDDTDAERSEERFVQGILDDLRWLGLTHDLYARQSERSADHEAAAEKLKAAELLYPCYETADELERKRRRQLARHEAPVYDRAALKLSPDERAAFAAEGRAPHWRFKLPGGTIKWTDLVRGPVEIDLASVSDPVLVRSDGRFLYTLPSVVDDIAFKISHVIRGEDHVTNTGAQIALFRALGAPEPAFAHHPLLVGADGGALSKRLGSLSIGDLAASGYEPMALLSLLAKIGTSDAVEPALTLEALAESFDLGKLGRAPARFDEAELSALNAKLLHITPHAAVKDRLATLGGPVTEAEWDALRANVTKLADVAEWLRVIEGPIAPVIEDESLLAEGARLLPDGPYTEETWSLWTKGLSETTGKKGKALFHPLRLALTGLDRGPEMKKLLVLIGPDRARKRLKGEKA